MPPFHCLGRTKVLVQVRGTCVFRDYSSFYSELSAPRSTSKLKDHPLSADRHCLFDTFAAYIHMEAVPPSAT